MLDGIPLGRAPRLGGYVRTHPRPGADLLLVTDGGDPLLARWPVGLGQVAAWTSDLGPRWAESWARWPPWGKFWGQLVRATMRARAARQCPRVARVDGGIADVDVEAVGLDDSVLSGLEADLVITEVTADGAVAAGLPRHTTLTETAPGRYEARFPIASEGRPDPGALLLRAVDAGRPSPGRGKRSPVDSIGAAAAGYGANAESSATGADLLGAIASRTGGGPLRSPEDLFRGAPPRPLAQPLRTQLLVAMASCWWRMWRCGAGDGGAPAPAAERVPHHGTREDPYPPLTSGPPDSTARARLLPCPSRRVTRPAPRAPRAGDRGVAGAFRP